MGDLQLACFWWYLEIVPEAVSVGSAALALSGHSRSVEAGWTAVAGGRLLAGAVQQSDHLHLAEG